MARLPILLYPDPRLRRKTEPVTSFDAGLQRLIDDMLQTMYEVPGIGLAAPQVNVRLRLLVVDVSEQRDQPLVLINPQLLDRSGVEPYEEGCLSVPGFYEPVQRATWIRFRALDRNGEPFEREAEGLLAVCIQHEMDHLEGKLFVDYLSEVKRQRIRKKLEKLRRRAG